MMGLGCQLSNLRRKSLKNGGQNGLSEKDIKNIVPQQSLQKVINEISHVTYILQRTNAQPSPRPKAIYILQI